MDTNKEIFKKYGLTMDEHTRMPIEIPNIRRSDLPSLFEELGFNVGAEIGVLRGEFSEMLCQGNPNLKLHCVDPWELYEGYDDYGTRDLENYREEAIKRLAQYDCGIIQKYSLDALSDFEDNSLDFVYLDANHSFQSVINDVCGWLKKVRRGGIISGHDYRRYVDLDVHQHVVEAISGYTYAYKIRPWFVIGEKKAVRGNRDKERSWMWVKQ